MYDHLATPAFLLDLERVHANIERMQRCCTDNHKQLWPMTKTHKSLAFARWQRQAGAAGFLCGTLDEAEALLRANLGPVMLAYPVMGAANLKRLVALSALGRLIVSIDAKENALACHRALETAGRTAEALLIIDTGIHRLGIAPDEAPALLRDMCANMGAIKPFGLSSHPGHAYSASGDEDFGGIAQRDGDILHSLRQQANRELDLSLLTASGCTPTFRHSVRHPGIDIMRPGVYPLYDAMQVAFGAAAESDCALSVLSTVLSRHEGHLVVDCGSKCLGLDKGAHGISSVRGHGIVIDHPELTVSALSEEVGRLTIEGETGLKPGDTVRIIPNHACSCVNMTSFLTGVRAGVPAETIAIDMRGNSRRPAL